MIKQYYYSTLIKLFLMLVVLLGTNSNDAWSSRYGEPATWENRISSTNNSAELFKLIHHITPHFDGDDNRVLWYLSGLSKNEHTTIDFNTENLRLMLQAIAKYADADPQLAHQTEIDFNVSMLALGFRPPEAGWTIKEYSKRDGAWGLRRGTTSADARIERAFKTKSR
ncbi:MAG: hypothetical protein LBJ03_01685 [Holosporales bacterium]|jgi:hypothetical protein|nr:hypothetical protein [Holosporales bacterium]